MFGWNPIRFWDAIKRSPERSQIAYLLPFDSRQYLDKLSRTETVRMVEGLAQQFGILKQGFRGIARHTIGKGLELQHNTADLKWNEEAELQFEEYAMTPDRFDLAGRRNLYDGQHLAVEQHIFRGEFFASATNNPRWNGEPCYQFWDTLEIESPTSIDEPEKERIFDGVRLDENNAPVEYFARTLEGKHTPIAAAAMHHWFSPTGVNQQRGESAFAPVINQFVDWGDLQKLFTQHAKTHASLAIAVKKLGKVGGRGAFGAIKRATGEAGGATTDTAALEKAFPGMIAYLGADGEAQVINSSSPSEALGKFITDVMAPQAFAALGIHPEFFWHCTRAGGPNQRFILSCADLLFQILADGLICRWLNAVAYRFTQNRIDRGKLAKPTDPNWSAKMSWQTPARLSIDRGDAQLEIDQLANGTINLRTVYDRRGNRWREETRQWIREWLVFDKIAAEEGATPEQLKRLQDRWRAPAPGTAASEQTAKEKDDTAAGSQAA